MDQIFQWGVEAACRYLSDWEIEVQAKGWNNFNAFRKVYVAEILNNFVRIDGLKVRLDSEAPKFSFTISGNFFTFIAGGLSDSWVDEVGVRNCEIRLNDGFKFEDVCEKAVCLARFVRNFKFE